MKNIKLNLVQVFIVAKVFLDKVFFDESRSDELNILHGGFMINKCKDNWQQCPEIWDESVWIDWINGAKEVLIVDSINIKTTLVDELQAYLIMKRYVCNFAYEFKFKDLIQLFKNLDIDKEQEFQNSKVWKDWMLSVNALLEDKLTDDDSLVSLNDFIVSDDQAFYMMELFLEIYCLKLDNKEIASVLQGIHNNKNDIDSSFYQNWITIYKEFCIKNNGNNISVVQAYNVMKLFLEQKICYEFNQDCLKKFKVEADQTPRDYMIWYNWLHVAYKVLLP